MKLPTCLTHGYNRYNTWEHSAPLQELYRQRCTKALPEMTCHAQGAELFAPHITTGDTLLDVGCGAGVFYHSLRSRDIAVEYWGIDATEILLSIGREVLPSFGLPPERLINMRMEDMDGSIDHIFCCNVLTHIDNYHKPLERMLHMARKTLIIRESLSDSAVSTYQYVHDKYLDEGACSGVYVNMYSMNEIRDFIHERGFETHIVLDRHTKGKISYSIDYPHKWTFLVAHKKDT